MRANEFFNLISRNFVERKKHLPFIHNTIPDNFMHPYTPSKSGMLVRHWLC